MGHGFGAISLTETGWDGMPSGGRRLCAPRVRPIARPSPTQVKLPSAARRRSKKGLQGCGPIIEPESIRARGPISVWARCETEVPRFLFLQNSACAAPGRRGGNLTVIGLARIARQIGWTGVDEVRWRENRERKRLAGW